jgi:hypothetical protein
MYEFQAGPTARLARPTIKRAGFDSQELRGLRNGQGAVGVCGGFHVSILSRG